MTLAMMCFVAPTWLGIAISRAVLGTPPPPSRYPHVLLRNPFTARLMKLAIDTPETAAGIAYAVSMGTAIMGDGLMDWSSGRTERAATGCHGKSHLRGCTYLTSSMNSMRGKSPRMEEARRQVRLALGEGRMHAAPTRMMLRAPRGARSCGTPMNVTVDMSEAPAELVGGRTRLVNAIGSRRATSSGGVAPWATPTA